MAPDDYDGQHAGDDSDDKDTDYVGTHGKPE